MVATSAAAASTASGGGDDVPATQRDSEVPAIPPAAEEEEASSSATAVETKKGGKRKKTYRELRAEGGPFTFNTPIGALNPFAIYYGLVSIFLGIPWFVSLKICQFLYLVTRNKFDPKVGEMCVCVCWMGGSR
jgi:hypothetical protein